MASVSQLYWQTIKEVCSVFLVVKFLHDLFYMLAQTQISGGILLMKLAIVYIKPSFLWYDGLKNHNDTIKMSDSRVQIDRIDL